MKNGKITLKTKLEPYIDFLPNDPNSEIFRAKLNVKVEFHGINTKVAVPTRMVSDVVDKDTDVLMKSVNDVSIITGKIRTFAIHKTIDGNDLLLDHEVKGEVNLKITSNIDFLVTPPESSNLDEIIKIVERHISLLKSEYESTHDKISKYVKGFNSNTELMATLFGKLDTLTWNLPTNI